VNRLYFGDNLEWLRDHYVQFLQGEDAKKAEISRGANAN